MIAFAVLFIGGWMLQFLGHYYEGQRLASDYRADLAAMMGEGDVTAR
jgi:uncharacterized membrane protein YGL010W